MSEPSEEQPPPNYLVDMRKINDGIAVKEPGALKLKELYERDYDKFLARWMAAEDKYRAQQGRPGKPSSDSPAADESPGDEGAARASELLDRLLGEAGS